MGLACPHGVERGGGEGEEEGKQRTLIVANARLLR